MNTVTLILPKNKEELEYKYSMALGEAIAEYLTSEEITYLINKLETEQADEAMTNYDKTMETTGFKPGFMVK